MIARTWPDAYINIIEGQAATCPKCGGEVKHSFFADEERYGFALLECASCRDRFVLSRVHFPESVKELRPMV